MNPHLSLCLRTLTGHLLVSQLVRAAVTCSVAFILQSTAFSCSHLETRCEAFLQHYQTSLEELPEETFQAQVGSPPTHIASR